MSTVRFTPTLEGQWNAVPTNPPALPQQRTPLIGREWEIIAVCRLLSQPFVGILTLTGPPGVGKTRLALAVAASLIDSYADGVYFVALAPISDPSKVISAIAQTLPIHAALTSSGRPLLQALKAVLANQSILLVLDNFEQVLPAAQEVAELLAACPHLKILATSRAPLHICDEQEFPLSPLALPDLHHLGDVEALGQAAAVALFVQRATAVKPGFALTDLNAAAVAEICTWLEGLPLALELAAAKLKFFSVSTLLAQLQGVGSLSPLGLLTNGARDLPMRQQSLRNAIEWSYQLLEEQEQALLHRLAVFVRGFTLSAAAAICILEPTPGTPFIQQIASLCDKNLLRTLAPTEGAPDGAARFGLWETIREYGLEQLQRHGEAALLQQRHADYFLTLAEKAQPNHSEAEQQTWWNDLKAEKDNLHAALQWAQQTGTVEQHRLQTLQKLLQATLWTPTAPIVHTPSLAPEAVAQSARQRPVLSKAKHSGIRQKRCQPKQFMPPSTPTVQALTLVTLVTPVTPVTPVAPAYAHGLTAREAEVLSLVAGGLTNLQIAEKLIVSIHTINAHVSAIFGKLGVNKRSAATRFALEHRLVSINGT